MTDLADLARPSQLWKRLPADRKQLAAEAFWRDENAPVEQAEAAALIAQRIKFRLKSVHALPIEKKSRHLLSMPSVSEAVAARLLVSYHLLHQRPMMARFLDARADGSTLSGNWLYIGMYTDAGNLTQRRSGADPSGLGRHADWAFSWPANRRILYNRCSADSNGRAWDPARPGITWNGERWTWPFAAATTTRSCRASTQRTFSAIARSRRFAGG